VAPGNEGRGAAPLSPHLGLGTPVVVVDAGGGAPLVVVVVVGAGVVVVLSACLAGTESVGRVEWCGERAANTSVATTVTTTEQAILAGFDMDLNRAPNSCRRAEGPRSAQPQEASRRSGRCLGSSPRGRKRLEATDSLTWLAPTAHEPTRVMAYRRTLSTGHVPDRALLLNGGSQDICVTDKDRPRSTVRSVLVGDLSSGDQAISRLRASSPSTHRVLRADAAIRPASSRSLRRQSPRMAHHRRRTRRRPP